MKTSVATLLKLILISVVINLGLSQATYAVETTQSIT